VTSSGVVGVGTDDPTPTNKNTISPRFVVSGNGANGAAQVVRHTSLGNGGGALQLSATRGSDADNHTIVQNGDGVGTVAYTASDGVQFVSVAEIVAQVDGTPGVNDLPGRLVFKTTADGASAGAERMRLTNAGNLGIGSTTPATKLDVVGDIQVDSGSDICIVSGNCLSNMSGALTNTQVEGFIADDITTNYIPFDNGTKLVSSGLFWNNGTGQLSIGHTSAVNNLSVADASSFTGNMFTQNEQFPLEIRNTDTTVGNFASIIFRGGANTSGGAAIGTQFQNQTPGSITGDIVMGTNNLGTFSEKFRIKADGKVGIGSTAPTVKLDVNGDIRAMAQGDVRFGDADSSNFVAFQAPATVASDVTWTLPATDGTNGQLLSTNGSGDLTWAATGADNLGNHTATANIKLGSQYLSGDGGNEGISVDSTGQVGIGSASPSSLLDVSKDLGDIDAKVLTLANISTVSGQTPGTVLHFFTGNRDTASIIAKHNTAGGDDASLNFEVRDASNTMRERMRINNAGKIGIGSVSPSQFIDIDTGSTTGDHYVRINSDDGTDDDIVGFRAERSTGHVDLKYLQNSGSSFSQAIIEATKDSGAFAPDILFKIDGVEGMRISGTGSGFIGMGQTAPIAKLDIKDDSNIPLRVTASDTSSVIRINRDGTHAVGGTIGSLAYRGKNSLGIGSTYAHIDAISTDTNFLSANGELTFNVIVNNSDTEAMRIDDNANLGIGVTAPVHKLQVAGTAGLSTGTAWTNTSDIRLKDIRGDYDKGLNEIMQLRTVKFNYKEDNPLGLPSDKEIIGFIAQEVEQVIPEAVVTRDDGYLELNVDPIHWALVNATQEQQEEIEENLAMFKTMQGQVSENTRQIASLKEELSSYKEKVDSLEVENKLMKEVLCELRPSASFCR
jgi:hypothetical protein